MALVEGSFVLEEQHLDEESSEDDYTSSEEEDCGGGSSLLSGSFVTASLDDVGSGFLSEVGSPKAPGTKMPNQPDALPMKEVLTLDAKGRQRLSLRVRMCVIYAAIWGFGGIYNSTSRRKFFESIARNSIEEYVDPDNHINIPYDCSIFEIYILLTQLKFVPATYRKASTVEDRARQDFEVAANGVSSSDYLSAVSGLIPNSLSRHRVDVDIDMATGASTGDVRFRTPSQLAVGDALRTIMRSGGNSLVYGHSASGKTYIINALLKELGSNCPTPSSMRQDVVKNLQSLVGSRKTIKGGAGSSIPNTLAGICSILKGLESKFKRDEHSFDDTTSFTDVWLEAISLGDRGASPLSSIASSWRTRNARNFFAENSVHSKHLDCVGNARMVGEAVWYRTA